MSVTVGLDLLVQLFPAGVLDTSKKPKSEDSTPTLAEMFEDGASASSPWCPVEEGVPFKVVLKLLATKARRVPVLSKVFFPNMCFLLFSLKTNRGAHK